ncbi:hypothetical protein GCM10011575_30680 [Microlunatus endophyticus]|uniref:Deaminase n=1 Tax=Microlunatus endophyticus TaxID=1716077 RepID=A0A917SBY2_9ACTN|nr:hypothetical protein [Microlunatus endophyticus]GGL69995.1 hypothetical protein GCM10011575_30680 [Microlunatus endophyticus]
MSARFVYWMNVSLDLKIAGAPDDHGAGGWLRITESLHREFNARAKALSVSIEGRVTYELMDPFWPDARTDESLPAFMREYGEIWTSMPKVLVSRTRTTADHNTGIIGDNAIDQLAALRIQPSSVRVVRSSTIPTSGSISSSSSRAPSSRA